MVGPTAKIMALHWISGRGLIGLVAAQRADGHWNAYIDVEDVDELSAELDERVRILRPPYDQPYGKRELEIADCNGYVLCFGQTIPAAAERS